MVDDDDDAVVEDLPASPPHRMVLRDRRALQPPLRYQSQIFFFGDLFVWSDGPASFMLVVIYFFIIIIFLLLLLFIETDATRRRGVIVGCMVAC